MTKRASKAAAKPEAFRRPPNELEMKAGDSAAIRVVDAREEREKTRSSFPRLESEWPDDAPQPVIGGSHNDANRFSAQLTDSLGVVEPRAASFLLNSAINGGFASSAPTDAKAGHALAVAVENAMSFVTEVQPQNAVESALALQMAAAHSAAMTLARHAARADDRIALADHNRMMNQTMRTFTAQAEALHKLRTGGKQQVEVRYVYVDARTQTVVNGGSGDGGAPPFHNHPHTPGALGYAPAPGLPVWGEDPRGDALSLASGEGASSLQDARGHEPRRAERTGERKLHLRAVDSGGHSGAGQRSGAAQGVQDDAA